MVHRIEVETAIALLRTAQQAAERGDLAWAERQGLLAVAKLQRVRARQVVEAEALPAAVA